MTALTTRAPGKVNLCLYVGPSRPDGLHELVSVIQPLALADELRLEPAEADEVICEGVEGENLAGRALDAYREAAGLSGHWRLTIEKHVPVAAGMGGGSSDAAAALRLAARAAGRPEDPLVGQLAPELGADVPALLDSRPKLVTGAGEEVRALDRAGTWSYVIVPVAQRLSTPDVYAEADRLGLPRSAEDLAGRRREVEEALAARAASGGARPQRPPGRRPLAVSGDRRGARRRGRGGRARARQRLRADGGRAVRGRRRRRGARAGAALSRGGGRRARGRSLPMTTSPPSAPAR